MVKDGNVMTKQEYMNVLAEKLRNFDKGLSGEIIEDYEGHFRDGKKSGKGESEICEELGNIDDMISELQQVYETKSKSDQNIIIQDEKLVTTVNLQDKYEVKENESDRVDLVSTRLDKNSENKSNNESYKELSKACKRVVIHADCADVRITPSKDNRFHLHYSNNGSEKQQMLYHFSGEQKGDTFYGTVTREHGISNFFLRTLPTDLNIHIELPHEFMFTEINGISGDVEFREVEVETINVKSISGDIKLKCVSSKDKINCDTTSGDAQIYEVNGTQITAVSKSGDIEAKNCLLNNAKFNSMSGDIEADSIKGLDILAESFSGDVEFRNITSDHIKMTSKSGDIELSEVIVRRADLSSISGNVSIHKVTAEDIIPQSVSGELNVEGKINKCNAKSTSGSIAVRNYGNLIGDFRTVSGNINIEMKNDKMGYTADVKTISGRIGLFLDGVKWGNGKSGYHTIGAGSGAIKAESMSGDIKIQG